MPTFFCHCLQLLTINVRFIEKRDCCVMCVILFELCVFLEHVWISDFKKKKKKIEKSLERTNFRGWMAHNHNDMHDNTLNIWNQGLYAIHCKHYIKYHEFLPNLNLRQTKRLLCCSCYWQFFFVKAGTQILCCCYFLRTENECEAATVVMKSSVILFSFHVVNL